MRKNRTHTTTIATHKLRALIGVYEEAIRINIMLDENAFFYKNHPQHKHLRVALDKVIETSFGCTMQELMGTDE